MRLALVSQEYPPETAHGGIGTQTYVRAHGLSALGHDVHVISHSTNHERREYHDGAVQVTRIPGFDDRLPITAEPVRWLTYSAQVAVAVSALHAQAPLDVVVFPEWGAEGYVHLLNQAERNRIPTIVHIHGPLVMFAHTMGWPEMDSEFYRTGTVMEGTCLRLADAVSASSRCSAQWCAEHYGLNLGRIPILHTGVDTQLFAPREISKAERPTILFVGSLARNKGVHLLLEAACRLAQEFPGLHLRMLGKGEAPVVAALRAQALAAGLPDLLELPGFVNRKELPIHFSRAHVFAGPSTYEGGPGNVYLEAMACGLPVVACEGSGASEVVIHDATGFLIPADDAEALTYRLRQLLSDTALREAMSAHARRHMVESADSKACLKRLEAFYTAVAFGPSFAAKATCS